MLGKRTLTLAAVGVLALSGTGYALYRDQQAERRPLPAPLSLPSSSSPTSEASSIPPSVLGDTASQETGTSSEMALSSLPSTENPLLRLRWQENAWEQLANGDFIIKPDGVLALARRSVTAGILGRHVIEADDIDSNSVTSRTIRDKTVAGEDLADDLSLGDVTVREGLTVSGDTTLAGDLDVAGIITGSFAGAFAPSGDVDMTTHLLTNIGDNGTDFTTSGGLTLADTLTVSAGGASVTGTLSLPSLTASRLLAINSSSQVVSSALSDWLSGTANQVTVTEDGDGTATLSLPQSIHTGATPTFAGMTLSGFTQGSIPFIGTGGALSEDPTNLYWDGTNHRLGIGTTPAHALDISAVDSTSYSSSSSLADVGSDLLRLYNSDNTADGYAGILMMHRSSNVSFARIAVQGGFYSPGLSAITFGLRGPTGVSINERMRIVDNGNVGIGTTSPGTKLAVSGLTGTSSYNLVRVDTATGNFYYDSSSARYKDDIHPFDEDFSKILGLSVKEYTDKTSRESEIGLIAEELDAAGLNHLVIYKDGVPDAIKYDRVPMYLLGVLQNQEKRISDLEADGSGTPTSSDTFDALTTRMDTLETTSAALTDFYMALSLDTLLMKDTDGNLDLGDGALLVKKVKAETVEASASMAAPKMVTNSLSVGEDKNSPTLGTATIKTGETEVTVETEAVTEKSRIFVTPEVAVGEAPAVTERADGKSFTVEVLNAPEKDLPFSWWIVESGTGMVPAPATP